MMSQKPCSIDKLILQCTPQSGPGVLQYIASPSAVTLNFDIRRSWANRRFVFGTRGSGLEFTAQGFLERRMFAVRANGAGRCLGD